MIRQLSLTTAALLSLASCIVPVDPGGRPTQLPQRPGYSNQRPSSSPGYVTQLPDRFPVGTAQGRISAEASQGAMIIRRNDGQVLCSFRTAMPNVETWRLVRGDTQIIVKSRGARGPATVELFDTATGTLRDKVLAYAIRSSGASWAYGFED
ncbi:MAG TPA: hypothetical protein PK490_00675 [Prosthecobacter sp.]|nr:hypothetical protein [Prosthecobacter sp.]HRK12765.1 hypothetical protein [Prosthecobacter sp.]